MYTSERATSRSLEKRQLSFHSLPLYRSASQMMASKENETHKWNCDFHDVAIFSINIKTILISWENIYFPFRPVDACACGGVRWFETSDIIVIIGKHPFNNKSAFALPSCSRMNDTAASYQQVTMFQYLIESALLITVITSVSASIFFTWKTNRSPDNTTLTNQQENRFLVRFSSNRLSDIFREFYINVQPFDRIPDTQNLITFIFTFTTLLIIPFQFMAWIQKNSEPNGNYSEYS